ncbi:MAG: phosphatase PAP2 family protein [Cellulomonadaceae bacterium]
MDGGAARADARPPAWVGPLLVVLGAGLFALLAVAVRQGTGLARLDEPVLQWMIEHRTPVVTAVLTVVTTVFGPFALPVLVAAGCAVWGWRTGQWRRPLLLVGAMLVATMVSSLVKLLYGRPRPPPEAMTIPHETSFSFPSGHTIGAATLVFVLGYLLWSVGRTRRGLLVWATVSVAVVGLVAGSRLYLGYHFVTDVLAGVCLALAVLGLVVAIVRRHPG